MRLFTDKETKKNLYKNLAIMSQFFKIFFKQVDHNFVINLIKQYSKNKILIYVRRVTVTSYRHFRHGGHPIGSMIFVGQVDQYF